MVLNELDKQFIEVKLNTSLYTKEVIFETCYILLDDYYFFVDLQEDEYVVKIFEKQNDFDKEIATKTFLDELIETTAQKQKIKETQKIREVLLEKALLPFTQTSDIDEKLNQN